MNYLLGIDGGGTKTKAVIADMTGEIVAQTTVGPTNPNVVSNYVLSLTFKELFASLKQQHPDSLQNISSIYAGISGAGNEQNKIYLVKLIKEFVPNHVTVRVEADTVNALYSGTYGNPGIVQISGTGSITFGINSSLKQDRVGGWGYLFGDEGSGYDIGRQGVIAALKSYDGRSPKTIMLQMMYTNFDVNDPQDLIHKLYTSSSPKSEISPLSRIVFEAYKQGDPVAKEILEEVVKELKRSILTLYKKLFQLEEAVDVVLCGGVFNAKEILPQLLKKELNSYSKINLVIPEMPPVGGSLIGAYVMQNIKPNPTIITNIINTV